MLPGMPNTSIFAYVGFRAFFFPEPGVERVTVP